MVAAEHLGTAAVASALSVEQVTLGPIALFPLLGAALAYLVGRQKPAAAGWIATAASGCAFLWVLRTFFAHTSDVMFEDRVFSWFLVGDLSVDFMFRYDSLTSVMCLIVTGIGTLIHLYSIGYMAEDESRPRFFAYLNLFMFSMLLLVLGGNLLVMFVGWEGVGLCSYLLIGFWFKDVANARAGRKAFVVNRIGDAGFLIAIFLCFKAFGSLDFVKMAEVVAQCENLALYAGLFTAIAVCLFIGATGKSAQIPLFVWLPDAMAGPTPVSALIHAATMVTAGVYMMSRCHFIFSQSPDAMALVIVVAVVTAFVAGTTALCQNDIKKVLAYSTVSQLGFMFIAVGAGAYWVAIFHVMTHAFFKACLFLGAGSVIHGCHHEQDMRQMGGLRRSMPITHWTYLISTLAIAGIAPFSGYYSKHAIVAALADSPHAPYAEVLGVIVTITALITAFYMTRSLVMTFYGPYRGHAHPHESPWNMTVVLAILAVLAFGGGFLGKDLAVYLTTVLPDVHFHHESIMSAVLHSWMAILTVLVAFAIYLKAPQLPGLIYRAIPALGNLLRDKYYVDEFYALGVVRPLQGVANLLWRKVDQNVIDGMVNGTAAVVEVNGELTRRVQSGQIGHYAFFILTGSVVLIAMYLVL